MLNDGAYDATRNLLYLSDSGSHFVGMSLFSGDGVFNAAFTSSMPSNDQAEIAVTTVGGTPADTSVAADYTLTMSADWVDVSQSGDSKVIAFAICYGNDFSELSKASDTAAQSWTDTILPAINAGFPATGSAGSGGSTCAPSAGSGGITGTGTGTVDTTSTIAQADQLFDHASSFSCGLQSLPGFQCHWAQLIAFCFSVYLLFLRCLGMGRTQPNGNHTLD